MKVVWLERAVKKRVSVRCPATYSVEKQARMKGRRMVLSTRREVGK